MAQPEQIAIDEKYTYQFDEGRVQILRHGQPWLDSRGTAGVELVGAKAWIAAACRIEELETQIAELKNAKRTENGDAR